MVTDFLYRKTMPRSVFSQVRVDVSTWSYSNFGLALKDLAAMLAYDKIAVTDQERGDIVALARQMGMDLGPSWPGPTEGP